MTISERIRAAALKRGRMPMLANLLPTEPATWGVVVCKLWPTPSQWDRNTTTNTERRMFLLFVAEALESQ